MKVSVIIPVRNEAANIGSLLHDLLNQSRPPDQIICVNDGSTDASATIIKQYPVTLINLESKPDDWIGKSYACHVGAKASLGELLLFLDSDVRLDLAALACLLERYLEQGQTISVLPYHLMQEKFEQQSLFFNLIQAGANGLTLFKKGLHAGLYGPVILIAKQTYNQIGTHETIKRSIVDDVALGHLLLKKKHRFTLYLGGKLITYRMYRSSRSLYQGWIKNYATGIQYAPPVLNVLTFLWLSSILSVTFKLGGLLLGPNQLRDYLVLLFYPVWLFELHKAAGKLGSFKPWVLVLFPVYSLIFLAVFLISALKKILRRPVAWKGRNLKAEK